MKMKAQIAMLASGMLAIAATGIVFAIPAFAVSSPGDLSVNYGGSTWACAEINGSGNPVQMNNCFSTSAFFYPTSPGTYGQIRYDSPSGNSQMCMQLDAVDDDTVIMATCNSSHPSYQEWAPYTGPDGNGDYFYSEWNTNYCLTYDEQDSTLRAITCGDNWYQVMFTGF